MCQRCGDAESEWRCQDCGNIQLCGVCCKLLHSLGVYTKHKVEELKDTVGSTLMNSVFYGERASPSKRLKAASSIKCKKHPIQTCTHFDMEVWKPVCRECMRKTAASVAEDDITGLRSPPHKERNLVNIEVAFCKTLHDIRQRQKRIANKLVQQTEFQKSVSGRLEENELKFEEMQRKIKKGFEELKAEIDLKQNEMLQDLVDLKVYNKGTLKDTLTKATSLQERLAWLNQLVLAALDEPQFLFLDGFQYLQTEIDSFLEQEQVNLPGLKSSQWGHPMDTEDETCFTLEDLPRAAPLQFPELPNFVRLKKVISQLCVELPNAEHQNSPIFKQKELFEVVGGSDISPAGTLVGGERLNSARASIFTDNGSVTSQQDQRSRFPMKQSSKRHTATKIRRFTKPDTKLSDTETKEKTMPSFRKKVKSLAQQTPQRKMTTPDLQRGLHPKTARNEQIENTPKRASFKNKMSYQQSLRRAESDTQLNDGRVVQSKSFFSNSSNKLRSHLRKQGYFNGERRGSPINGISSGLNSPEAEKENIVKKETISRNMGDYLQSQSSVNSEHHTAQNHLESSYSSMISGEFRKKPLHKFRFTGPAASTENVAQSILGNDPLAPREFILSATTSTSIQVGWTHPRNRSLPINQQLIYILEYEMKQRVGQDFRKIYKGRAFKCIITDLLPATQYRFRVAPIIVKQNGIEVQGEWGQPPLVVTTSEPQKLDEMSLHSHATLSQDADNIVRPGIVHAHYPYTFGRQYWIIRIMAPSVDISSASFVIGIVAKNESSKMIGSNFNFNVKKGLTQTIRVMLNAEAATLTVNAPNEEPETFTNLPEGFKFHPGVFYKSSKPLNAPLDVEFRFDAQNE